MITPVYFLPAIKFVAKRILYLNVLMEQWKEVTVYCHSLPLIPDGSLLTNSQEMTKPMLKNEEEDTINVSSYNLDAKVEAYKITGNMLLTFIAE